MISMTGSLINFDQFKDTEAIKQRAYNSLAAGGPNSGFEIEGIDFFKEKALTNEFPEMKDEIDLIISSESYVTRLTDLYQRMVENKGMSRGMAIELNELVPSLESHFSPNRFTEDISGVGVEASMEALSAQMWTLIAAAVAFVVGLIYKFFSWLSGGGTEGGNTSSPSEIKEGIKENAQALKEVEKVADKVEDIVKDTKSENLVMKVAPIQDHAKVNRSRMSKRLKQQIIKRTQDIINGRVDAHPDNQEPVEIEVDLHEAISDMEDGSSLTEFLNSPNKYGRFLYGQDRKVHKWISQVPDMFDAVSVTLSENLVKLEGLIEFLDKEGRPGSDAEEADFANKLELAVDKYLIDGRVVIGGRNYSSLSGWYSQFSDAMVTAGGQTIEYKDLEDLMSRHSVVTKLMAGLNFNKLAEFIDVLKRGEEGFRKSENYMQRREKNQTPKAISTKEKHLVDFLMSSVKQMAREYQQLMHVYSAVSNMSQQVHAIGDAITKKAQAAVEHTASGFRNYSVDGTVPEALAEISDKLAEQAEVMKENDIKPGLASASTFAGRGARVTLTSTDASGKVEHTDTLDISHQGAQDLANQITKKD